ncbi:hypothetical protein HOD38_04885 [archaeon]|jgi:hypothetical protein|nr:hypothetical protein [archaeon]MBT4397576.1 hypothetical protein [archaeon]MBT4440831.1 hypothetical protein [archaeon]
MGRILNGVTAITLLAGGWVWNSNVPHITWYSTAATAELSDTVDSLSLIDRQDLLNQGHAMPEGWNTDNSLNGLYREVVFTELALKGLYNYERDKDLVPPTEASRILKAYEWGPEAQSQVPSTQHYLFLE